MNTDVDKKGWVRNHKLEVREGRDILKMSVLKLHLRKTIQKRVDDKRPGPSMKSELTPKQCYIRLGHSISTVKKERHNRLIHIFLC